jgi:hypothetical protein
VIYRLSEGTGQKTIYVKYKDNAGNESAVVSITVDYQAQTVEAPVVTETEENTETTTPDETRSLALLILGSNNQPLANVKIVIAGIEAFTDENGVVIFNDLEGTEVEILGVYDNQEFRQSVTLENSREVITIVLDSQPQIPVIIWICIISLLILVIIAVLFYKRRQSERK